MPLQATSGAASYDAFGGGVAVEPNYIESVFSTFLYTGNNSTQNIVNGIDISTKGGLVWSKSRSAVGDHHLYDTARGLPKVLFSNGINPSTTYTSGSDLSSFNTTGFSLGPDDYGTNTSGVTYVSWTFREQPKFFDVVTYTGNDTPRTIAHNLGSVPGCIIFKRIDNISDWAVYHRGLNNATSPQDYYVTLNNTSAQSTSTWFGNTAPTSTVFSVGDGGATNQSGATYVAYLFAHNAGGFGLTGTDNVISCGSFTTDGSGNASVNLGYEPQWIMTKCATNPGFGTNWSMLDTMRGWTANGPSAGNVQRNLIPNLSNAESTNNQFQPNATGFTVTGSFASSTIIYIAIRRGPMKVPTDATKVYNGVLVNSSASTQSVTAGFPVDLAIKDYRNLENGAMWFDRLRGITSSSNPRLLSATTGAEANSSDINGSFQTGVTEVGIGTGYTSVDWFFRRAPGFLDEVCYTGTGTAGQTYSHNLGVVPEFMIVKSRSYTGTNWNVYVGSGGGTKFMRLDTTLALTSATSIWNDTNPTASVFTVGTHASTNQTGETYVAYLFASAPGVSKVGSYTGNGSTQTIDCGFTGGARFVLIKRTDASGDWYVYDTARGMTTLTDPYLLMNSTAAEVATLGSVTTVATGFAVNAAILAAINASGASYVFLAIA